MRELTPAEEKRLGRYLGAARLYDRMDTFFLSRAAANSYLSKVGAAIPRDDPDDYQLTYLQGITTRMSKNYRKLRGAGGVLRTLHALRDKTLRDLRLGGR